MKFKTYIKMRRSSIGFKPISLQVELLNDAKIILLRNYKRTSYMNKRIDYCIDNNRKYGVAKEYLF
jgi:hypothetical protein